MAVSGLAPLHWYIGLDYLFFTSLLVVGLGIMILSVGLVGFYWNYGGAFHIVSATLGVVTGGVFFLFGLYCLTYIRILEEFVLIFFWGGSYGFLMLAASEVLVGISLILVRDYTGRDRATIAAAIVAIATIITVVNDYILFLGLVVQGLLVAYVFYHANVPFERPVDTPAGLPEIQQDMDTDIDTQVGEEWTGGV